MSIVQRRRTVAMVVLAVLAAVGIGACGAAPPSSAAAAFNARWLDEALQVVKQVRTVTRAPTLAPSTKAEFEQLGRSVDDVIARAPRAEVRNPQIDAALAELVAAREFKAVVLDATVRRIDVALSADEVAKTSTADQRLQRFLSEDGDAILLDAACDSAFNLMVPAERDDAKQSGFVPFVKDTGVEPVEGAISNYGQRAVAAAFGPGALRAVEWFQFGKGIEEKARRLAGPMNGTIVDPNSDPASRQVLTRAYVYYVKTCLAPPR